MKWTRTVGESSRIPVFSPVWTWFRNSGFEGGDGRENLSLWSRAAQRNKTRNGSDNQRLKDRDSGSGVLTVKDQTQ